MHPTLVFFLGMAYISYLGWVYGEPYQILYGKDYLGNRCGVGAFAHRSKTVYPRLDADLLAQMASRLGGLEQERRALRDAVRKRDRELDELWQENAQLRKATVRNTRP